MRGRTVKSKKGMSLVELIAVMAISVVVVAAALLALYGGSRGATDGSADYANQGDAHLLETWLRDNLPTAKGKNPTDPVVQVKDKAASAPDTYSLGFTPDGSFAVSKNGKSVLQISGIESFTVSTVNSGSGDVLHPGQNQTLQYVIKAAGSGRSFVLSGGIVLNNVLAVTDTSKLAIPTEKKLTPMDAGTLYVLVAAG